MNIMTDPHAPQLGECLLINTDRQTLLHARLREIEYKFLNGLTGEKTQLSVIISDLATLALNANELAYLCFNFGRIMMSLNVRGVVRDQLTAIIKPII